MYFAILNCANEVGWKTQINIPNSTLMSVSGITSKTQFVKLRNFLAQKELIEYKKGKKGTAPSYIISTLYSTNQSTNNAIGTLYSTHSGTNVGTNMGTNQGTIYKNKQKEKENINDVVGDKAARIFEQYERLTGKTVSGTMQQEVDSFLTEGMEPDLILAVIDYAFDTDKGNWNYMRGTLNNLLCEGVKSLAAFKKQRAQHQARMNGKQGKGRRSKFNNYVDTDSQKSDYAELEEMLLEKMLNEGDDDV